MYSGSSLVESSNINMSLVLGKNLDISLVTMYPGKD